jgi:hypothetical protein
MVKMRAVLNWGAVSGSAALLLMGVLANRDAREELAKAEQLRAQVLQLKEPTTPPPVPTREPRLKESSSSTAVSSPSTEETSPAAPPTPKPELTREERQYREQVLHDERAALYQKSHSEERLDPEWGSRAADIIRETLSGSEFDEVDVSADCRATMCRVDLAYSDAEIGRAAVTKLRHSRSWSGQRVTTVDTERNTVVSYVAREGFTLPVLDEASVTY